ncbi:MAG: hypothetical protein LH606_22135 [Cytophagaceae bacterium]|nr:hypothetical protein [Cytophagaceae bacterium]
MKTQVRYLIVLFLIPLAFSACKPKVVPLLERIRKEWTANIVKEGATEVYRKGAASNVKPGYSNFKLDMKDQAAQNVRLTEVDGAGTTYVFVGTWELSADEKTLTLRNLNPQPTGTNGIIEFTINGEVTGTQLNLTRKSASLKTGGTTNDYQLIAP